MSIGLFRGTLAGLTCATAFAAQAVAADPVALRAYNAAIDESSISGISSGGFMAVQFGTAWSSVIKGVGVIAGGPYWCAKADANDFITWYWGPIFRATGSCMKGPPANLKLNDFTAKANAKAASGDIDPIQNLSRQKIYVFHGYNDKLVARAATDATADSIAIFSARPIAAICITRQRSAPVIRSWSCRSQAPTASMAATRMILRTSTSAPTIRQASFFSTFTAP